MFKPTPSLQKTLRRLPLSVKQAGREYYKGNKTGTLGTIDKWGRFHPDFTKIRTFVYPAKGIEDFEVSISLGTALNMGRCARKKGTDGNLVDAIRKRTHTKERGGGPKDVDDSTESDDW